MSELKGKAIGNKSYWAIGIAASLVTAFIFLQPIQVWTQGGGMSPSVGTDSPVVALPTPVGCIPFNTPFDPIDMNTVISQQIVKTIHVEKEIFRCDTAPVPTIFMVSIYTKLFEDLNTLSTVKRTFEVVTCAKTLDGTVLGCQGTVPSAVLPTNLLCQPAAQPLAFPIEMNSVVGQGPATNPNLAKTVEAEKELFQCSSTPGGPITAMKEVTIFTGIYEDMTAMNTIKRNYDSATCIKDISHAQVVACKGAKV